MIKSTVNDFAFFGGAPVFSHPLTTMNLVEPDRETFYKYAKASFDAQWMSNNGPAVQELERQLALFHHVKHCIAMSNGFTAICLALHVLSIPKKKEIIVSPLTYRRMADIIDWAGLTPCFCDVDPQTQAISPQTAELCINDNTAGILAPHPRVHLCDISGMESIAKKYKLPLIFDSVEACGATYKGVPLGGFGNCEVFSMHADKVINACEGGYITTNDDILARKLKIVRAFGFSGRDRIECLGYNAKLNELHAAMALASFINIDQQIARNKKLHLLYQEVFRPIQGIHIIPYDTIEKRNWRSVLIYFDKNWPLSRDATLKILNAERINARPYYYPPLHKTFKKQAKNGSISLSVVEHIAETHAILPMGTTVNEDDIPKIGETFQDIFNFSPSIYNNMEM